MFKITLLIVMLFENNSIDCIHVDFMVFLAIEELFTLMIEEMNGFWSLKTGDVKAINLA